MPRQLVNLEEQGKLIAKTNGAILMINESNYIVKSTSGDKTIPSLHPNLGGLAHVQIMRATMPSTSMYIQLNFTAV